MDPCYEDSMRSVLKNIEEKNFDSLKTIQDRILKLYMITKEVFHVLDFWQLWEFEVQILLLC